MRYGAVDIGTNSCRLLIADQTNNQPLTAVTREMEITRIGEGINQSPLLQEEAILKPLDCLRRFNQRLQELKVEKYRAIATSAVRDAQNGTEFAQRAMAESAMKVDIVTGEEEARLSYMGVSRGLELTQPPLVVDLGGGSTEFICPAQEVLLSIPLGAVRATEAGMSAADITKIIKQGGIKDLARKGQPLVLVGGTSTTLVAIQKGLIQYDSQQVHGTRLHREEIAELYNLLARTPLEQRRQLPGLQPERADIINQGVLIILTIMDILSQKEIIVSESDLLEGIIWSISGR